MESVYYKEICYIEWGHTISVQVTSISVLVTSNKWRFMFRTTRKTFLASCLYSLLYYIVKIILSFSFQPLSLLVAFYIVPNTRKNQIMGPTNVRLQ